MPWSSAGAASLLERSRAAPETVAKPRSRRAAREPLAEISAFFGRRTRVARRHLGIDPARTRSGHGVDCFGVEANRFDLVPVEAARCAVAVSVFGGLAVAADAVIREKFHAEIFVRERRLRRAGAAGRRAGGPVRRRLRTFRLTAGERPKAHEKNHRRAHRHHPSLLVRIALE